ncbi:ExeM/NucH family extracellular endonuclease [Acinetobacter puyangensis]|uniref:Endonuclease/exonuclease/phosphatase domain-containing protein n=1 Tax=Acinetobacter puyangensis TaxID=1096779 RepID=A0A240E9D7_9GAMM|nr:ExeM/NucH family extracellular endonuclease [Acinetobacter puyangensis]SNX44510.1 hypothetical protein SAMN05421731_103248 [Acinetobacter puyangensis]
MKNSKHNILMQSFLLLGASSCFTSAYAQLMFSNYIHGSGNNKGMEVYNPDAATVNLADYQIKLFANGAAADKPTTTVTLAGYLASKGKYLVGHADLKTTLGDAVKQVGNLNMNGDDTLVLYYKGIPVDIFGQVGFRPDTGWAVSGSILTAKNSFERTKTSNNVSGSGIDIYQTFDVNESWKIWSSPTAYSTYLTLDTTSTTPAEALSCTSTYTSISDVRKGSENTKYNVRGIITADYRYANGHDGFFLQTPDTTAKSGVSNGIFVYVPTITDAKVGDDVILNGTLGSYNNQLQIKDVSKVRTCNTSLSALVKPKSLTLPLSSLSLLEQYQGELIEFKPTQTLTISENYNYGRYGALSLTPSRLFIPTQLYPAGSSEAKTLAELNERSEINLDDGYGKQNINPLWPLNFSSANTLRAGAQLNVNVKGVLSRMAYGYAIQPILTESTVEVVADSNKRPSIVAKDSKQIRVAAFNVLNYDNGAEQGFPTERGATTEAEFKRQHAKIVAALKDIDADVYGLMEIANNGYDKDSALAYLTNALGADWQYVTPKSADKLGGDAIAVAIIYNSKRVKPVNDPVTFDFADNKTRTTIAQSFQPISGGKTFTVVPQHLKSKSCSGATDTEADQNDGQSCWNPTRKTSVEKLIQWLAKNPTGVTKSNTLILGDMNSYAKEEPILLLQQAGFKTLLTDENIGEGKAGYSYVFGVASNSTGHGGAGSLDHALADADLYPLVKKTFAWHINADEPTVLDYNEEYKTDEQKALFYAEDAYRSSDHDPVIVDLDLNEASTTGKTSSGSFGIWTMFGLIGMGLISTLSRRNK